MKTSKRAAFQNLGRWAWENRALISRSLLRASQLDGLYLAAHPRRKRSKRIRFLMRDAMTVWALHFNPSSRRPSDPASPRFHKAVLASIEYAYPLPDHHKMAQR